MILTVLDAMVAVAAAVVLGHNSSAVAAPIQRVLRLPGSSPLFGPGPATPPARFFMPGPLFAVNHGGVFATLALAVLVVVLVGLGLAMLVWFLWARRHHWHEHQ
jgi:hypothetical protein